jgi:Arc/MetJ-type ribon-helix-helix transcriptional regulator
MSESIERRVKGVAEALAPYGSENTTAKHAKVSISLPADLVDVVRAIAADSNLSVSAVVAAALRRTIEEADQARLDRALDLDAEENLAWANAYLPIAAKRWSEIEW